MLFAISALFLITGTAAKGPYVPDEAEMWTKSVKASAADMLHAHRELQSHGGSSGGHGARPPPPPAPCAIKEGTDMPKTTDATPDPVNEPCYSHDTCKKFGDKDGAGYICCVGVGTCDNLVSNSDRYYLGGCAGTHPLQWRSGPVYAPVYMLCPKPILPPACQARTSSLSSACLALPKPRALSAGINYKSTEAHSDSTSTEFPSTRAGCAKQGECNLHFLEQVKGWTATNSSLEVAPVPWYAEAAMLEGATENVEGACPGVPLNPTVLIVIIAVAAVVGLVVVGLLVKKFVLKGAATAGKAAGGSSVSA